MPFDQHRLDDYAQSMLHTFQPRRRGNKNALLCDKSSYTSEITEGPHDHDYFTETSKFDILHYAESRQNADENEPVANELDMPVNTYSYIPVQKKPCLETPTPPLQLFRLKMF